VLLPRRRGARIAPEVAPRNPYLGVMLAYSPLHHLLLRAVGVPVVATSGNLRDEPICIDNEEALSRLGHIADAFLVHDRPIVRHVDDSVFVTYGAGAGGGVQPLRRARGYAPLPITVERELPQVLAVGAHLKNVVALGIGHSVFLSQHIGDMETPPAMAAFERVLRDFVASHGDVALAFPVHPNPNVSEPTRAILGDTPRVHLLDPLPYAEFIHLLSRAWLIVSDSGGVQEEAPSVGKALLVLRRNTERPEAIDAGVARLVGGRPQRLAEMLEELHADDAWIRRVGEIPNPFGRGDAGARIADAVADFLGA